MTRINYDAPERQLKAKLAELAGQRRDHGALQIENSADLFDQIQASVERDLLVGLLNHDRQLRDDVRHACELIAAGTYGICEECEQSIAPARLKAIPWARFCVRCQDRLDREVNEADVFSEAA
jgi:DnaK suppressor protein